MFIYNPRLGDFATDNHTTATMPLFKKKKTRLTTLNFKFTHISTTEHFTNWFINVLADSSNQSLTDTG